MEKTRCFPGRLIVQPKPGNEDWPWQTDIYFSENQTVAYAVGGCTSGCMQSVTVELESAPGFNPETHSYPGFKNCFQIDPELESAVVSTLESIK